VSRFLQEKAVETTKKKGARGENPTGLGPEEQEGMPRHQHCPPAKRREARAGTQSTMKSSRKTLHEFSVLTLWHAFLFLGLSFFLFSSFCLVASTAISCKKFF
jgi:hypothetical protein